MHACCSGSGIRGNDAEISRQIPASVLIPEQVLQRVSVPAADQQASQTGKSSLFDLDGPGGIVAIYAAQPHETTPERLMPDQGDNRKYYGLLTWTICEVLSGTRSGLTYSELAQAIQNRYVCMGRRSPTPLIEGTHRDRLVLGKESFPDRSRIRLNRDSAGHWTVSAGSLQRLTAGSILAVYPEAGTDQSGGTEIGHVEVVSTELATSVVRPCAFEQKSLNTNLPGDGRCEVVFLNHGELRMQVAVDHRDANGSSVPQSQIQQWQSELRASLRKESLVAIVESPEDADWLIRLINNRLQLIPASGVNAAELQNIIASLPPVTPTGDWAVQVLDQLERVARSQNLLRLMSVASQSMHRDELGLSLAITDTDGNAIDWNASGRELHDGQAVTIRMKNSGRQQLDVTLLYVDSSFGISCLYPSVGELNRLGPGHESPVTLEITADTTGLEHLVVIAVRGQGQPVDFSLLEQPSLAEARREQQRSTGGSHILDSPLGRLCQSALYGSGGERGVNRRDTSHYGVDVMSWRIMPAR